MGAKKVINKAFIIQVTRDLFLYQTVFALKDISFLSMYMEVLKGSHEGCLNCVPRTEGHSI